MLIEWNSIIRKNFCLCQSAEWWNAFDVVALRFDGARSSSSFDYFSAFLLLARAFPCFVCFCNLMEIYSHGNDEGWMLMRKGSMWKFPPWLTSAVDADSSLDAANMTSYVRQSPSIFRIVLAFFQELLANNNLFWFLSLHSTCLPIKISSQIFRVEEVKKLNKHSIRSWKHLRCCRRHDEWSCWLEGSSEAHEKR